jgi:hypothetical protein
MAEKFKESGKMVIWWKTFESYKRIDSSLWHTGRARNFKQ